MGVAFLDAKYKDFHWLAFLSATPGMSSSVAMEKVSESQSWLVSQSMTGLICGSLASPRRQE